MDQLNSTLLPILQQQGSSLLSEWVKEQLAATTYKKDLISQTELQRQSEQFIKLLIEALQTGQFNDINQSNWQNVRDFLKQISNSRNESGFTSSETATFIFSLKQPIFKLIQESYKNEPQKLAEIAWESTLLVDKLGLYTVEAYQKTREDIIKRQQEEMLELSTPVVKLWDSILALPMIGTLDSNRTQIVMESLLQTIVETGSEIAIIDITGVPNVDTLVAQHLLKTVTAARLMGADCIISGIRPQIAQTIVHLGVDLQGVVTKATLADAFKLALIKLGITNRVQSQKKMRDDNSLLA